MFFNQLFAEILRDFFFIFININNVFANYKSNEMTSVLISWAFKNACSFYKAGQ